MIVSKRKGPHFEKGEFPIQSLIDIRFMLSDTELSLPLIRHWHSCQCIEPFQAREGGRGKLAGELDPGSWSMTPNYSNSSQSRWGGAKISEGRRVGQKCGRLISLYGFLLIYF